jgi:hypothetical protein
MSIQTIRHWDNVLAALTDRNNFTAAAGQPTLAHVQGLLKGVGFMDSLPLAALKMLLQKKVRLAGLLQ